MGTFYDREIEYLESTGTQYIDTGIDFIYGVNEIEIYLDVRFNSSSKRQLMGSNGYGYLGINVNDYFESSCGVTTIQRDFDFHKLKLIISPSTVNVSFTVDSTTITAGYTLTSYIYRCYLFALGGRDNAAASFFCDACIKRAYIIVDNKKVRDFVPVRVGTTGYLFDRVTCQLFGNAGTGSFVLGPDMYDARVEYVGTRGLGKAFPTGYIPTGTDIVIDMSVKFQGFTAKTGAFFYTWNSDTTTECYCLWRNGTTNNQLLIRCGNKQSQASTVSYTLSTGTTYNFRVKWGQAAINYGTYTINTTAATNQNLNFLYLSTSNTEQGINQDIYYFKVYKASVLVCDLIPVRKGQTPCVYDRITNRTFEGVGNGTGSLVMGNDVPDIPSDYDAEVDYIVFDGSQSIDTGLYGDLNTDVKVTCRCPTTYNMNVAGARNSDGTNNCDIFYNNSNSSLYADFYDNSTSRLILSDSYHNWVTIQMNKDLRQVEALNKTVHATNTTQLSTEFRTPNTMRIGGFEGVLAVAYRNFIGQMGAVQIKQNGVLVRDYIPVRKNGVGYLYDKITQKMFGNEFSSSFGVGMDKIKPIPITPSDTGISRYFSRRDLCMKLSEFKRLNYISNEGSSFTTTTFPYIVIGRNITPNTKIVIDYYHQANGSQSNMLFGRWSNSDVNIQTRYSGTVGTWIAISNTIKGNIAVGNPVNHRHYLTVTKDGASDVVDNTTTYSVAYDMGSTFKISNPYLFWASGYYNWLGCRWRVYNFQLYENDVLVMNLIPVQNPLTKINGMYDTISRNFMVSPRNNFIAG